MIALTAYGDFNCPFSALSSARVDQLERRGIASVEWRAVEHDRDIATDGAEVDGDLAQMLTSELDQIRELLAPGEPIVPVLVLPDGYVSRKLGALARLATLLEG